MKGLMRSKLTLTLATLVMLIVAVAIPLLNTTLRRASADISSYPANIEHDKYGYGTYEQSNLTNPDIGGVGINMNWADIEPQQNAFNWTPMDNEMAAWSTNGKKYILVIRYASDIKNASCSSSTAIQYLPAWEATRIPTLCSAGGDLIPDYFDATFQSDLQGYLQAIAQHVAESQYANNLEYIRIGVGVAGEGYPCVSCSSTDIQQLIAWGYSIANWAAWQKQMLTSFKTIFSPLTSAPLIYPLGDNDKDPTTKQSVAQEVGYWGAAQGIGVGQQGLQNTSGFASGAAVKIAQYVRAHYPSDYIQFQTVSQITKTTPNTTEVQGDIAIANSAGAFTIEWYGPDTVVSAYQPYFQQWQQTVDCTYAGINCPPPTPTPSPGTILAQDTFQRPDQQKWGIASDTQLWGADANRLTNFSITQTTGQIAGSGKNATNYTAVLGPSTSNAQVQFNGALSSFGGNTLGAILRWTDTNNFYRAFLTGTNLVLQKKVNGSTTKLKSISFAGQPGISYTIGFSVVGSTLSVSVWPTGQTPPGSWMVTTNDSSISSAGYCGLLVYLASGILADVSSFQAVQQ